MTQTKPKFTITVDVLALREQYPRNADVIKETVAAIRRWCDMAETHGLGGNIMDSEHRVIGKAHLPRTRTVY